MKLATVATFVCGCAINFIQNLQLLSFPLSVFICAMVMATIEHLGYGLLGHDCNLSRPRLVSSLFTFYSLLWRWLIEPSIATLVSPKNHFWEMQKCWTKLNYGELFTCLVWLPQIYRLLLSYVAADACCECSVFQIGRVNIHWNAIDNLLMFIHNIRNCFWSFGYPQFVT
jgi:hypothetical protein